MLSWLRERRRQSLLAEPFPPVWRDAVAENVRHFHYLDSANAQRLENVVQVMIAEKSWVGGGDFELTDAMKVTVAGYAGVMTLGLEEPYYFDRLKSVIIYPGAYVPHLSRYDIHPPIVPLTPRLGESWHGGPIVLSWSEIVGPERERPGNNVVFHEFAHHIDSLDGEVDGTPSITDREKRATWYRVADEEFAKLRADASSRQPTLLDRYGASNRAEFFAVASECFFERPRAMRERHTELYQSLADFYCQDVARWLPDAT